MTSGDDIPDKPSPRLGGFTTSEALSQLHKDINEVIAEYDKPSEVLLSTCKSALQFSVSSVFPWPALLLMMVCTGTVFIAVGFTGNQMYGSGSLEWLAVEGCVLLITMAVSTFLSCWNCYKWQREALSLSKRLSNIIQDCCKSNTWTSKSYSDLNTPISPCISLQWTQRDGQIVNLPQALLVRGDIIYLRPGHKAPAKCEEIEPDSAGSCYAFEADDLYIPEQDAESGDGATGPRGRRPLASKAFRLIDTPIVLNFRKALSGQIERPQSVLSNECHRVVYVWITQRLLPMGVMLVLLINALRFVYLPESSGLWPEMFLVLPVHAVLPLVPLMFPLLWIIVNTYGQARIMAAFHVAKTLKAWPLGSMSSLGSFSTISVEEARVDIGWNTVWSCFLAVWRGSAEFSCRNFDLLHVLGNVTSLCCIDKKGILSWANPSAEKVFFFSSSAKECLKLDMTAAGDTKAGSVTESTVKVHDNKRKKAKKFSRSELPGRVEVLDLTHDAKDAFRVFFDDPEWRRHLDSVKPLGLTILLNTCSTWTADWYTQFSDHVGCSALQKEETVAVVNRREARRGSGGLSRKAPETQQGMRCLCEVARQIGFTAQALEAFTLEKTFGIYKQVSAEETEKERAQRAKSFLYHKIPMPNFSSVIVRDRTSGMCQLLTQGTADIVLDSCSDYWDGSTVRTLTDLDRKRILDFYNRNSMAAYCTAFSYKPIAHNIASHMGREYIELVGVANHFFHRSFDLDAVSSDGPGGLSKSFSMDSLIEDDSLGTVEDVSGYYDAQKNQIFLGMATLQYQARQDFVQLIEKLESSCIRFVHFSKENELRSRVFSEKMGLEAGWNCHISLLKDELSFNEGPGSGPGSYVQGRQSAGSASQDHLDHQGNTERALPDDVMAFRSQSAPCVIAVEEEGQQVKFNMESPEEIELENKAEDGEEQVQPRVRIPSDKSTGSTSKSKSTSQSRSDRSEHEEVEEEEEEEEDEVGEGHRLLSSSVSSLGSSSSSREGELDHQSDSRYTSSYVTDYTDDSLTGALDNRAQLPRGIDQIRPHLEQVDNVPLLVNLFTDCTAPTTQEMMKILQENGEVVLCIGSSLNVANTPVFLQADCSITIEPLYPQLCAVKAAVAEQWSQQSPSPTELASRLLALPCSLAFQREDNISILQLIAEARHHTASLRNCFYLLLCCQLCIVLSFLLSLAFLLPPPLSPQHLLWLLLLALPLLAAGLMGNPVDPKIMTTSTNKNKEHVNRQMVVQFLMQFFLRFVPSIFISLICFGLTLYSYCHNTAPSECSLYDISAMDNVTYSNWEEKFSGGLVLAQNIFHLFTLIFFVVISMSLVHWLDHIWHHVPFTNKLWSAIAAVLCVLQVIFSTVDIVVRSQFVEHSMPISDIHPAVWVLLCVWPVVIILLNELVKCLEIRYFLQHQRRARLAFDTKLGMNSPF
ncbi:transmembrane protein 94-like isoform X2 [Babylonia areolata]|uniref:transmembrane protein 94-like isoform X2 n=1 Tax=Babylonia areolata TaxID=304850 RepID=UPI003FD65269